MSLERKRLAILGIGNMGGALLRGILDSELIAAANIMVTSRSEDKRRQFEDEYGVQSSPDNAAATEFGDLILVCVKPQGLDAIAADVAGRARPESVVISILAGVTTARLEEIFGTKLAVVRSMPNIPSMVAAGATAICGGRHASDEALSSAESVFRAVGEVVRVAEPQMDAVTGLSGSGPAYIYMIIEALTDGGVKMGLARDVALRLASQTVLGSAKLVQETAEHPAVLRDQVTTPGGTAIAAIHDLEDHGLRPMLISAVVTATERSKELGEG